LIKACVAYYATQQRLEDPTAFVRWSVPHNGYGLVDRATNRITETVGTSYAAAIILLCHRHWPADEVEAFDTDANTAAVISPRPTFAADRG
jgi:hypothetical protein